MKKQGNIFNLKEATRNYLVPKKGFEKNHSFDISELEEAVSRPDYNPKENAKIFYNQRGDEIFRISEADKTYSERELINKGFKQSDIKKQKPVNVKYIKKENNYVDVYTESQFKESNEPVSKKDYVKQIFKETENVFLGIFNGFGVTYLAPDLRRPYKEFDTYGKESYFDYMRRIAIEEIEFLISKEIKTTTKLMFQKHQLKVVLEFDIQITKEKTKSDKEHLLNQLSKTIEQISKKLEETVEPIDIERYKKSAMNVSAKITDNYEKEIEEAVTDALEKEQRKETFSKLIGNKPYHEQLPARKKKRHIIIYEAPTNSGKTYTSCNEIVKYIESKKSDKAVCMFPLRALAAQIKDEFIEKGIPCSLVTGEERELTENAQIECITTEALSIDKHYKVAFIDESQLLFDTQRGPAYAKAILGTNADTVILAVAPAYKESLLYWLNKLIPTDTIEERVLTRLCPLHVLEKPVTWKNVEKGDLIVAFTVRDIHFIAEDLSSKFKVGVIYGKMSPSARRAMVRDFMLEGFDVLIATDAIGMGISVPAKRVLFAGIEKFDGVEKRKLSKEEIRQVAGRAGRFGFYDEGYCGVYDLSSSNLKDIETVITTKIMPEPTPGKLTIAPDKYIFLAAEKLLLLETIGVWSKSAIDINYKESKAVLDDLKMKAEYLDTFHFDRKKIVDLMFVTFGKDKDGFWEKRYKDLVADLLTDKKIETEPYDENFDRLEYHENYAADLTLFSQLQRIFPEQCPSEQYLMKTQEKCGEALSALLKEKYATIRKNKK